MKDRDEIQKRASDVLKDIRTQITEYETKLRELRAAVPALERLAGVTQDDAAAHLPAPQGDADERRWFGIPEASLRNACRNKSIPDGAIALLRMVGQPLSEERLVEGLRLSGVTFVSDNPETTLRFALLKKRKETGTVILTDEKLWDALGANVDEPPVNSGFVQNRDRNEHAERSRQGLLAARMRGAKNGRRSKITPELRALAIKLLAEGNTKAETARQIGITPISLTRWIEKGYLTSPTTSSNALPMRVVQSPPDTPSSDS